LKSGLRCAPRFIMRQNAYRCRGHAAPRQSRIESGRVGAQLSDVMHDTDPCRAFSSQVETLGGSENATKQAFSACRVSPCERDAH
jgi:hypothetical protein